MANQNDRIEPQDAFIKTMDALFPGIIKKALFMSVGSVVLTEEAIRKLVAEFKLPKDMVAFIIQQSNKSKNEIIRILTEELRSMVTQIQIEKELRKVLQDLRITIQMEINFEPRKGEDEKRIQVATRVTQKRPDRKKAQPRRSKANPETRERRR